MKNEIVFEVLEQDGTIYGLDNVVEIGEAAPRASMVGDRVHITAGRFTFVLTPEAAEDVRVQLALILDTEAKGNQA